MTHRRVLVSSIAVAGLVALALFLRPARTIRQELSAPAHISPEARAALRARMQRHAADMHDLVMYLLVLDHDGAARVAGRVFDEATLGPTETDETFRRALPKKFFALQATARQEARSIVAAAVTKNTNALVDSFNSLTRACVACHQAYLFDQPAAD